jgi:hypothetical protein
MDSPVLDQATPIVKETVVKNQINILGPIAPANADTV